MRGNIYCVNCRSAIDADDSHSNKSVSPLPNRSWHIPSRVHALLIFGIVLLAITCTSIYQIPSRSITFTISVESNTEWYSVIGGATSCNVEGSGPETWTVTMNGNMLSRFSVFLCSLSQMDGVWIPQGQYSDRWNGHSQRTGHDSIRNRNCNGNCMTERVIVFTCWSDGGERGFPSKGYRKVTIQLPEGLFIMPLSLRCGKGQTICSC